MRRLGDIAVTAAITAVVTMLVNNAMADTSAIGRAWHQARVGFVVFADRAAPVLAAIAGVLVVLWLGLWLVLLSKRQRADAFEIDLRLPNPMTILAFTAVLMLAAAYSLGRAAAGSDVAAVLACCIGVVALRSARRLIADVRTTLFGALC